jgi:large subunit ribosomal protein L17
MRHQQKNLQINRDQDHKESLKRNMVTQLFLYEKIKTTARKAKFIIPKAERLIQMSIKNTPLNAIRELKSVLNNELACRKVLEVYKERYKDRKGGFTRTTKLGSRKGDNAPLVLLELV